MNSRQPPISHTYFALSINQEDNSENAMEWLRSGELTPKLFKKHLRHTAKDISQGLRRGEEVTGSLMENLWYGKGDDTTLLRALSSAIATVVVPQSTSPSRRMEVEAKLGTFLYYKNHRNDARGSVIDVKSSLADTLKSIRSFVMTDDKWADNVGGSYRSNSPSYKLSETQFVDTICDKLENFDSEELWHECEKMRRTANALLGLTGDYRPIFYTCWECDKVFVNVLHCGKCRAALYCSRKCQKAGWKGGHKETCGLLKVVHESFLANVEEVQRVHVTGMQDGLELSPQKDCVAIRLCMGFECIGSQPKQIQGSMKSFYENLGRIHRGEWWVYDLSEQDNYADNAAIDNYLSWMLRMLAIDWFEYTRLTLGTVSVDPQQVTALTDPLFRSKYGTPISPISAKTLLEMYCAVEPEMPFRPEFKAEAYKYLTLVYNEREN